MHRKRPRILLVEDEDFLAALIERLFDRWGCCTVTVGTVERAILSLDIPLDLIVLDLVLPDGDGGEVLRKVRQINLGVKVVIWTASALHDRQDLLKLKPDLLLSKPTSLKAIENVINEVKRDFSGTRGNKDE